MRSPSEPGRWLGIVVALMMASAQADDAVPAGAMTAEHVQRVVAEMKADPALNGKHIEHKLRFKNLEPDAPRAATPHWLLQLARWIADAGRGLVWVLGAIAVALFAVFAWRWASVRSDVRHARADLRPSHVNELDIRPESLPADIGAAARALYQRGERRAALSLLYRGALSRLVHDHLVPIRAASTEGECVRLATHALPAASSDGFARLVGAWQTEVYAGRPADGGVVAALCDAFDAHFPRVPARAAPVLAAAA